MYFALDCEMVGCGPDGFDSVVARVTVINWENEVVLDTFVQVPVPVTDFRTQVSGIKPEDLQSENAMSFDEVRTAVENILRGKILIGHGLENDLCALGLTHPWCDVRDTACYGPYMRRAVDPHSGDEVWRPRKLRDLAWEKLDRQIQFGEHAHCPVEDAKSAMDLYKAARNDWEQDLSEQQREKALEEENELLRLDSQGYWAPPVQASTDQTGVMVISEDPLTKSQDPVLVYSPSSTFERPPPPAPPSSPPSPSRSSSPSSWFRFAPSFSFPRRSKTRLMGKSQRKEEQVIDSLSVTEAGTCDETVDELDSVLAEIDQLRLEDMDWPPHI